MQRHKRDMPRTPEPLPTCGLLRPAVLLVVAALAADCAHAAGADPPDDVRRQVAQGVVELSSSLRSERTRAEQKLLELGPQVLELLPAPEETTDEATRVAVRQIRIKLERRAAERSVLPSRVTLRGEFSVTDAARLIDEQTHNHVDVSELAAATREKSVRLDLDQAPFWDALAQLNGQASIFWQYDDKPGSIELRDGDAAPASIAATNVGAFRVTVENLMQQRGTLRAGLRLEAEPRLRPLFVRIADADFVAESGGVTLPVFSPRAVTELPMTDRGPAQFSVLFQQTAESQPAVVRLTGSVNVHVAAAPTEVRFTDLTTNRTVYLRHGGVSVTLKRSSWKTNRDGTREFTARLSVAYDTGGPEFESHRTWIYHNEVRLETADGQRVATDSGFEATRQADGGVEVEYRFSNLPARPPREWQLAYVAPMLLIDVPVKFEFEECRVTPSDQ